MKLRSLSKTSLDENEVLNYLKENERNNLVLALKFGVINWFEYFEKMKLIDSSFEVHRLLSTPQFDNANDKDRRQKNDV